MLQHVQLEDSWVLRQNFHLHCIECAFLKIFWFIDEKQETHNFWKAMSVGKWKYWNSDETKVKYIIKIRLVSDYVTALLAFLFLLFVEESMKS